MKPLAANRHPLTVEDMKRVSGPGSLLRQSAAFTFVGAGTALLDFCILWFLTDQCAVNYLASAAVAFLAGSTCNYFLSTIWVFENGKYSPAKEFTAFLLISVAGLALNQLIMWFGVDGLGVDYRVTKGFSILLVALWNFFGKKKLVFKN